jgi:hypothetical protein
MLFRAWLTLAAAAALVAAPLAACSSTDAVPTLTPESGTTCQAYVAPTTFDPTSPPVSFTNDVLPLINRSCAFTSCHGSLGGPTGGMYLGSETSKMYLNLVGVPSTIEPSMARVAAGDPANSFLQHKIDGDTCTLSECISDDCMELMPQGQDLMAVNDRLTFRAWIAQGALADFTLVIPDAGAEAGDEDAGDAGTADASDAGASDAADAADAADATGE